MGKRIIKTIKRNTSVSRTKIRKAVKEVVKKSSTSRKRTIVRKK